MAAEDSGNARSRAEAYYDPIKRAEETARLVCNGDRRRYYRFRPARFYGGIGTADCLGCCLQCLFCWSWDKVLSPDRFGEFYSPRQVAEKLTAIARSKRLDSVRISGNEPTLARGHLIKVLEQIPEDILFILESNGILLGHDPSYAGDLSRFTNLSVRVSMKGTDEAEFVRITGAAPEGFGFQMQALENLARSNVTVHPAVMVSFSNPRSIKVLMRRLRDIRRDFADFEVEELVLYGKVEERLIKAGIECHSAYEPSCIPPEQV